MPMPDLAGQGCVHAQHHRRTSNFMTVLEKPSNVIMVVMVASLGAVERTHDSVVAKNSMINGNHQLSCPRLARFALKNSGDQ